MKKVTDVISEMGSIFSEAEENFSIPKVKQPIKEEESFMYSLHQSSGIFKWTKRERALLRDEKKRAYAESLKKDMERGSVVSNPKSSHTENVTASNLTYIENSNKSISKDDDGLRLINGRLWETPLEPDIGQDPCVISVRHISLGFFRQLWYHFSNMPKIVYNHVAIGWIIVI